MLYDENNNSANKYPGKMNNKNLLDKLFDFLKTEPNNLSQILAGYFKSVVNTLLEAHYDDVKYFYFF